jgi:hypothetical protein
MKGLIAATAVVLLLPAALDCDFSHQDCAKLQITDRSGEPHGEEMRSSPPKADMSPAAAMPKQEKAAGQAADSVRTLARDQLAAT